MRFPLMQIGEDKTCLCSGSLLTDSSSTPESAVRLTHSDSGPSFAGGVSHRARPWGI